MSDDKKLTTDPPEKNTRCDIVDNDETMTSMVNEFGETEILKPFHADATTSFVWTGDTTSAKADLPEVEVTGQLSFAKYHVDRILGRGAFGAVYLAHDTQLDRRVAVKVPVISASTPEEAAKTREKFLIEARSLARLAHPGIVRVLDVAVEGDQCYIVSEFLDGPDLKRVLTENAIDWQHAAEITSQIADALAYAHSQSTVHRDLKPGNVIITQRAEGMRAVIVDFGLAISDSPGAGSKRGMIAGTPNYMSPEQALGGGHRIDGRTDIFALGVILYRMLCGELPFTGNSVNEVLRSVVASDPIAPRRYDRGIPEDLEVICLKAMSKDVAERYTTAGDMASELRLLLSKAQTNAHPIVAEARPIAIPKQALRRQVTVLNCECDLFDSDDFLEKLSAEDQHASLREYLRVCRTAVDQFGGTPVLSSGQTLLVCFGYPTAYEDAARRAVRTGLELMEKIAELRIRLSFSHGIFFDVRMCVHTGAAVLQDADAAEGESLTMMGEARTVAKRAQNLCPGGNLIVTEATQRIVHGYFDFTSIGETRIKGVSEPLGMFIVRGESHAQTRIEVGEGEMMTPLVGRTEELALLGDLWDEASESTGQVVCVIGEAGLGKSRLMREIRENVKKQCGEDPPMLLEWRCSPFFQNTALHPATAHLESVLQYGGEPSPTKRLDSLIKHLGVYQLADPETVWLLASMLSLPVDDRFPPLRLSPQRQKEQTLDALLNLLRHYAAKQSVLFAVEDLHWVDATTLELLTLLVDQCDNDRILTLFTFRPEFETPWGSRVHQTQIALNRLTRGEVESMICGRVGLADVAGEVVDRIIERTEGVPLFIEEFCNALVESKTFVTVDGKMRFSDNFDILAIPATLKDLLISRLDRLDIRSDIVLLGATIGREFSYKMLRAITEIPDEILKHELDRIVSAEIVYREGNPPDARYTFKHALIQDAAYDSLLTADRKKNHLNVARALESDFPETIESTPEVLAHHFTEAGQRQQGIQYWLQAGQQAQSKSASNEAISHLQAGLKLAQSIEDEEHREQLEMAFRFPLIAVLMGARGYASPEIEPHHKRVQEIGMKSGDPNLIGRLLLPYWQYVFINGDFKKSLETTDSLLENAAKANDAGLATEAHWSSGCTKYFLGRFKETVWHERQALSTYHLGTSIEFAKVSFQNSGPLAYAFMSKALWAMGKVDVSFKAMDDALRTSPDLPEPFSLVVVNWNSADLGELMRDPERTDAYAMKTIRSCEELGFPFFLGMATCSSGNAMFMRGQYEAAAETIQRGIKIMMATGADIVFPLYFTYLAETFRKLGRCDEANDALKQAFARLEPGERFYEAEMLRVRGEFAFCDGDMRAARRYFDQSLAVAELQEARSFALRTTLSIAKQMIAEGNCSQAHNLVLSATAHIEGGDHTPDMVAADQFLRSSS